MQRHATLSLRRICVMSTAKLTGSFVSGVGAVYTEEVNFRTTASLTKESTSTYKLTLLRQRRRTQLALIEGTTLTAL